MKIIGIDIGGTKMEAVLYQFHDDNKEEALAINLSKKRYYVEPRQKLRRPTEREKGINHILATIVEMIKQITQEAELAIHEIDGIGLALPGAIDPQSEEMLNGNTKAFVGHSITRELKRLLEDWKVPLLCANDANCFALAEAMAGAGQQYYVETGITSDQQLGIGIILGTGVGSGLVYQGKILEGFKGAAGEIGHTVLVPGGRLCYCGRYGCAEQYLSGTGIEKSYEELTKLKISGAEFFQLLDKRNREAMAIFEEYQQHLLEFLININNVLNPHYFVFGGGVSLQSAIYEGLEDRLRERIFIKKSPVKIYPHRLSDAAGSLGAALLFLK